MAYLVNRTVTKEAMAEDLIPEIIMENLVMISQASLLLQKIIVIVNPLPDNHFIRRTIANVIHHISKTEIIVSEVGIGMLSGATVVMMIPVIMIM